MVPGWPAREIDRQRVETESAAQKALAIEERRCPPIPRHLNSAEILPRLFVQGGTTYLKVCILAQLTSPIPRWRPAGVIFRSNATSAS
jgi:hypothetical protein